jgi:hypothetical protein
MQPKLMVGSKRCRQERLKVTAVEQKQAVNPVRGQAATNNDGRRTVTNYQSCEGSNHIVPKHYKNRSDL